MCSNSQEGVMWSLIFTIYAIIFVINLLSSGVTGMEVVILLLLYLAKKASRPQRNRQG